MASPQVVDARRLVVASVRAQALRKGLWQEHHGMCWWQSGLPAMAGNLVVSCGPTADPRRLQALARLLARSPAPAGWLLWPDQDPERQRPLLEGRGFRRCERIGLASLPMDQRSAAVLGQRGGEPVGLPVAALSDAAAPALAGLLQVCHGIPSSLADVVAAAFVMAQPWPVAGEQAGPLRLQTFAAYQDGLPVATITAVLLQLEAGASAVTQGGLLWLGTHPHWRRRGFARQVTLAACRWLQAAGVERIHVQAAAAAHSLYASLGFGDDGWLELWGCPAGGG